MSLVKLEPVEFQRLGMNSVRQKLLRIVNLIVNGMSLLGGPQSRVTHVLDSMYPLSDNHKYITSLCVSLVVVVFTLTKTVNYRNSGAPVNVISKGIAALVYFHEHHNI